MKIKSIQLKNGYRRFKNTTIDLGNEPKKIVALVGPNGSGKSSVFDGMLYIQNNYNQIGRYGQKDWKYNSMYQNPTFDQSWPENVIIQFENGTFQEIYNAKNAEGKPKTIFSYRAPHRGFSKLNIDSLSKIIDIKENTNGASSSVDVDDVIIENYKRLYSYIDKILKNGENKGYEDVKKEVIGDLNAILKEILNLEIYDHGDILSGRGTLFFKKPDQEKEFDFNVLSSGEKEVVDIVLDMFLKKEEFNNSIYIIDEPELHINTAIQRKLLKAIVEMLPENCQLWIATHSIGFLSALKNNYEKDSVIINFEGNFGSEEIKLTPMKKTRENWRRIFQIVLEDLTSLLAPEMIIYCEGRKEVDENNKEQGLDAYVYNTIFAETYPEALFISSGGKGEVKNYSTIAIDVLRKAFISSKLLKLIDRDDKSDEDIQKEVEDDQNLRILKRKAIENYIFDKEIIKRICEANSKEFNEDSYNNCVSDIKSDNLKEKHQELKKICGCEKIVIDSFKKSLANFITPDTNIYKELESLIFNSRN